MRIDCHIHTNHSPDSTLPVERVLSLAQLRGLDCLAITDHNTISAAKRLAATDSPVRIIIGEEISTKQGELIGLFLKEGVPAGEDIFATIALIRAQGGLVVLPHPCDRLRHHVVSRAYWPELLPEVDFIEGFNGRTVYQNDDREAVALGQKHAKPLIAGSDSHTSMELGGCGIEIQEFSSPQSFKIAVDQGCFFGGHAPAWVHIITKAVKYANKTGLRKLERMLPNGESSCSGS